MRTAEWKPVTAITPLDWLCFGIKEVTKTVKQKTIYCCEFCDYKSMDQFKCEEHEATHFNLSRKEYCDWRRLSKDAAEAGKRIGLSRNPHTVKGFDEVTRRLVTFEQKHNISNMMRKPSDFY